MTLVLDGTIARAPYSGVQLSVRHEIMAAVAALSNETPVVFAQDAQLLQLEGAVALPGWAHSVAGRMAWQQLLLPRRLQVLEAEALHAFAYTAPLRCPVPYVLNVHDIIALEHPEYCSWRNALHMRMLLPKSARNAAMNIVSTRHVAERLNAVLGIDYSRITVIPLGVDAAFFSQPAPYPHVPQLPAGSPYLLFVSNIEPKKDLSTLLDAYASCAETLRMPLVVIGRAAWKSRPLLQRLRHWPGPGTIVWLSQIPSFQLPAYYQHAFAHIVPSRCEGFGMPVLEAMAAGTPVIHSSHPALCEAAGGAGLAFETADAAALAQTLLRLLHSSSLRQECRQAGWRHVQTRTWQAWGSQAAQLLLHTAGRHHAS